jgi:hypothetical protein
MLVAEQAVGQAVPAVLMVLAVPVAPVGALAPADGASAFPLPSAA